MSQIFVYRCRIRGWNMGGIGHWRRMVAHSGKYAAHSSHITWTENNELQWTSRSIPESVGPPFTKRSRVRSREFSKVWSWMLKSSHCLEIWQTAEPQCGRDAFEISRQYGNSKSYLSWLRDSTRFDIKSLYCLVNECPASVLTSSQMCIIISATAESVSMLDAINASRFFFPKISTEVIYFYSCQFYDKLTICW